jgi:hypothetical protein
MTRFTKDAHGKYHVHGKKFESLIGTRAQVWHGTSYKTSGGLTKGHLFQNKNGRIVSKSKHSSAKKEMRLVKAGYGTKKGKFGFVKLNGKKSKKMRGGDATSSTTTNSTGTATTTTSGTMPTPVKPMASNLYTKIQNSLTAKNQPTTTSSTTTGGSRRRRRGGMLPLSPHPISGIKGTSGVDIQLMATNY